MKKTPIALEKKIRIYFLIVILVFIVGALLYNIEYGSLFSEIIQSINRVPASQEAVDQLQAQATDLMKEDAEARHLKLHELNVKVISHQMLDSSTAEAIFDINALTSLNYEKAEDSPVLKGLLEFKKQKQDTLSPSALEIVDQKINWWRDEINRYIIEVAPSSMHMKAVGKIKEGKLDPATIEFYSEKGVKSVEFFPYRLEDIPSDEEVQQEFYEIVEMEIKNAEPRLTTEAEKNGGFQNSNSGQHYYSKSPNGKLSAEVVRENGSLFDSVLIKNNDNVEGLIALENIFYTNIESTEWLDNTRYAICGHVNPSLAVYLLMDTQKRQLIGKYYGIGFTWNKNKDRLYYIETAPHFSGYMSNKIIDNEEHIYFETQEESIINKLAISDDEQTFIFYIDDSKNKSRKLIVAKMNKYKKLQKQATIDTQLGDVEFSNSKSIKITSPDGLVHYYDI